MVPSPPSLAHPAPILAVKGVTKRFGAVTVLHAVDLDVNAGEVLAVVGENGAGKSTLMHIIGGVCAPDEGTLELAGAPAVFADARAAQLAGIATVFQERSLFAQLSVAENIFAARQPTGKAGRIDRPKMNADARAVLARIGVDVDPATEVADLAPDQQQMIEVAKALSLGARVIIFDEPTAALTEAETSVLFRVIRQLRGEGVAVIYISHRLEEIFHLADRVTVLKDGRAEGTFAVSAVTPEILVRKMVGRELPALNRTFKQRPSVPRLEVRGLSDDATDASRRTRLRSISFSAYAGEILGIAGLAGAGRTELALAIIGARSRINGEVRVDGESVEIDSPAKAIAVGIGYLSEDRKVDGIFVELDLVHNCVAAALPQTRTWRFDRKAGEGFFADMRQLLHIACRDSHQRIAELSGGNQQKCLLARWLLVHPRILILDEPTRGVDVAAKAEVHSLLLGLREQGIAVIVISSDLPEILAVSDRILVMRQGTIAGELPGTASEEEVMRLASLAANAA